MSIICYFFVMLMELLLTHTLFVIALAILGFAIIIISIILYRKSIKMVQGNIKNQLKFQKQTEQKILEAILETEQHERERFAKDLHDQLGNIFSSMNIYFQLIKASGVDEVERESLMGYFKELINEAIQSTKEIAQNMNPNVITKYGLHQALHMLCERINNTGTLNISLDTNITEQSLSKDIEVNIYKIVSELINNTLKHASADRISLTLFEQKKSLKLTYQDNGVGFNYEKTVNSTHTGMGLSNIASRVAAIGGVLKFENTKETGICVNIQTNID